MFATDTNPDTIPDGTPTGRADGLDLIRAGLALLAHDDPRMLTGPARTALVTDLAAAADRVRAELLRVVAVWDTQGDWALDGSLSAPAALAHTTPLSKAAARRTVHAARTVRDHEPVADALAAGTIATGHVDALTRARAHGRYHLFTEHAAALVDAASELTVDETALVARRWAHHADDHLDTMPASERAGRDHHVSLAKTLQGWSLTGHLDDETGDLLHQALEHAEPPDPTATPEGPRSPGRRRADALRTLAEHHLTTRNPGGRVPARLGVLVDLATLAGQAPDDLRTLVADRERSGPIPRTTLARIACDAYVQRIVLAATGQVLDLGHETPTVNRAQRRALAARDRGCAWPGCDRPPTWCDAHHLHPWEHGGPTDLHNLALLCRRHHRLVHEHGWHANLDPDTHELRVTPPGDVPPGATGQVLRGPRPRGASRRRRDRRRAPRFA